MAAKICVPIQAKNISELETRLKESEKNADFIEIWLDQIKDLKKNDIATIVKMVKKPLIVVCKGRKEKGGWTKSEKERVLFLKEALKTGASYVDIGIHTDPILIKSLKKEGSIIISYHNFKSTPRSSTLRKIIKQAKHLKADVIKIATFANKKTDNLAILELVAQNSFEGQPIIGLCMGKEGRVSRIYSTDVGGFLMFAALKRDSKTAPGQLTVDELKQAWANM